MVPRTYLCTYGSIVTKLFEVVHITRYLGQAACTRYYLVLSYLYEPRSNRTQISTYKYIVLVVHMYSYLVREADSLSEETGERREERGGACAAACVLPEKRAPIEINGTDR